MAFLLICSCCYKREKKMNGIMTKFLLPLMQIFRNWNTFMPLFCLCRTKAYRGNKSGHLANDVVWILLIEPAEKCLKLYFCKHAISNCWINAIKIKELFWLEWAKSWKTKWGPPPLPRHRSFLREGLLLRPGCETVILSFPCQSTRWGKYMSIYWH